MSHLLSILPLRVARLSLAVALSSCGSDRLVVAMIEQGGGAGQAQTSSDGKLEDRASGGLGATATHNGAGGRGDSAADTSATGQSTGDTANGGAALARTSWGGSGGALGGDTATVGGSSSAVGDTSAGQGPVAWNTVLGGQGAIASTSEGERASLGGTSGTDTLVLAWAAGAGSAEFDEGCGCFASSTTQSCFIDVQTGQQACTIPCAPISDCSDGCPCADVEVVWDRLSESTDIECVTSDGCGTGGFCSIIFTRGSPYRLESSACVSSGIVTL